MSFPGQSVRRALLIGTLLLATVAAWLVLNRWVRSGSERAYLLIPPLFAALFLTFASPGRQRLKPFVLLTLAYLIPLTVFCAGYVGFTTLSMIHSTPPSVLGRMARELAIAVYFLVAVSLVIGTVLTVLRRLVCWLDDRIGQRSPPASAEPPSGRGRARVWIRQAVPLLLAVPIVLPYALATLYVHRVRVPNPPVPAEVAEVGFEDVSFVTADGLTLRGWFIPARQPSARTLLICHGLGANRFNFLPCLDIGRVLGANVLMFDFRGHGDSDGHTVSFGELEKLDVLAAVAYLRTERPNQARELIGFGISMGSSGLIQAAAEVEPPFDDLIIDSAYCSAVELTDMVLAPFPAGVRPWLTGIGVPLASLEAGCWLPDLQNAERIADVRSPLLIIHARDDEMISSDHSRRLYERAREPKSLWIPASGGHSSALGGERAEYLERVRRLVEGTERSELADRAPPARSR